MLKDYCYVCDNEDDGFIGIQFQNGLPRIVFPRGYKLSEDDNDIRKDIIGLIAVLRRFSKGLEGNNISDAGEIQIRKPLRSSSSTSCLRRGSL